MPCSQILSRNISAQYFGYVIRTTEWTLSPFVICIYEYLCNETGTGQGIAELGFYMLPTLIQL